ncbi:MAG: HNH endonuclease [Oscillatoriophycideae cyanobacterium NC_groundwater_1537_Pr4_S-0.65um_50_18]|nr:HNH endonuclease [Oscillatoriophycideae cyanobacterium NC_groundwater_1537_Pr4_S-0.65um_50_18]
MAVIPQKLRDQVEEADRHCCCYCQTSEVNSGIPMTCDHIVPLSKGGANSFENVCLACRTCNEFKSDLTTATDPLTDESVPLFDPRKQKWSDHFEWSADGIRVQGLTTTGRAMVLALRMNNPVIVAARSRWVASGWHPPVE